MRKISILKTKYLNQVSKLENLKIFLILILIILNSINLSYALENKSKDTKKPISINFANLDIGIALQRFASFVDLDLVLSPEIKGKVSLNLKDVAWDEALDAILTTHNLSAELKNNILIIIPKNAPSSNYFASGLYTEFIPIKFSKASQIVQIIQQTNNANNKASSILSNAGSMLFDDRTNTLIIRDKKSNIDELKNFVKNIDVKTKQIMIQARIVITTNSDVNSLGVNWGVRKGDISPNLGNIATTNTKSGSIMQTLLPSSNLAGNHLGRIAFGFLSSANVVLDLELAALEVEGLSKIVSSPQIITTDRNTAIIKSGEQIPYQKTDKNGNVEVEFKDALLSLEVTPKIANSDLVGLKLKINKDNPGQRVGENFAIETNYIETEVFVKNGDTLVIGGVMTDTELESISKVPFFGDIPVLGNLFKRKEKSKKNFELVVFITPKILNSN